MNGSVLPTTARSQIKREGGWQGEVWLRLANSRQGFQN